METDDTPQSKAIIPICFLSSGTAHQVVLNKEQRMLFEEFVRSLFNGGPVIVTEDDLGLRLGAQPGTVTEKPDTEVS
jgi:hypothetical protein